MALSRRGSFITLEGSEGSGKTTAARHLGEWLRSRGATIESGPEEYGYTPGYYAVFFYDPDGIKLEIAHIPN